VEVQLSQRISRKIDGINCSIERASRRNIEYRDRNNCDNRDNHPPFEPREITMIDVSAKNISAGPPNLGTDTATGLPKLAPLSLNSRAIISQPNTVSSARTQPTLNIKQSTKPIELRAGPLSNRLPCASSFIFILIQLARLPYWTCTNQTQFNPAMTLSHDAAISPMLSAN
jgi:hypothetical protein